MSGSPHAVFFGVYGAAVFVCAASVTDRHAAARDTSTSRFAIRASTISRGPSTTAKLYRLWLQAVVSRQLTVALFERFLLWHDRLALLAAGGGFDLAFDVQIAGRSAFAADFVARSAAFAPRFAHDACSFRPSSVRSAMTCAAQSSAEVS